MAAGSFIPIRWLQMANTGLTPTIRLSVSLGSDVHVVLVIFAGLYHQYQDICML